MANLINKKAETKYEFILEDGKTIVARKDDKIEYRGVIHTASHLFDALKDRNFNKRI